MGLAGEKEKKDAYMLVLGVKQSTLRLPVLIGPAEAQALIIATNHIQPPRPLTHELFCEIMLGYSIEIKEAYIHKVVDNVFHAEVCCERFGTTLRFDARASDAVVLATHYKAPIFTNDEVIRAAGVDESEFSPVGKGNPKSQLQEKLKSAIQKEDYELAARLRDEIERMGK